MTERIVVVDIPKNSPGIAKRRAAFIVKALRAENETANRAAVDDVTVRWEFWRITQSQYRYRPIGVVDLGEIEEGKH